MNSKIKEKREMEKLLLSQVGLEIQQISDLVTYHKYEYITNKLLL